MNGARAAGRGTWLDAGAELTGLAARLVMTVLIPRP
jgi:hypothetical protein